MEDACSVFKYLISQQSVLLIGRTLFILSKFFLEVVGNQLFYIIKNVLPDFD